MSVRFGEVQGCSVHISFILIMNTTVYIFKKIGVESFWDTYVSNRVGSHEVKVFYMGYVLVSPPPPVLQ